MSRRAFSVALLALILLQLAGAVAFATVCVEACPDDGDGGSCPPVCSLCVSCTHAQTAIVSQDAHAAPVIASSRFVPQQRAAHSSQLEADIFHVPLLG